MNVNRISVARRPNIEIMQMQDLLGHLKRSWEEFLYGGENKEGTLGRLFKENFPIVDYNERVVLEFVNYRVGEVRRTEAECKLLGLTYSAGLYATFRLICKTTGEVREQEVYFREIPMMTKRGTFILNGAERVIVSQLHRSPGIFFFYESSTELFIARIIPQKGIWLEFEGDKSERIRVKLGQRKKLPLTTFLRALGWSTDREIIELFVRIERIKVGDLVALRYRLVEPVQVNGATVANKYELITQELIDRLVQVGVDEVDVVEARYANCILNSLQQDDTTTVEEALLKLYAFVYLTEAPNINEAKAMLQRLLFDDKRFNLSEVGRYKLNMRLELDVDAQTLCLTKQCIVKTCDYLMRLMRREVEPDDIDHLGNRKVRTIGELFYEHLRGVFLLLARQTKERMTLQDIEIMTPQNVINIKPVNAAINSFFATNQLSQFVDQINPLSELTHKRRLSVLGKGGLSKERAGFEVRDVHYSHYSRVCPIETPEGLNVGLIVSMATFARLNKYGFLEAPYRKVIDGKVTDQIVYLDAEPEGKYYIASLDQLLSDGQLPEYVIARCGKDFEKVNKKQVNFVDASLNQLVGVSSSLIPFLEHTDANRALMGSNMQRQAVPLLVTEPPLVGTGVESIVVRDCGIDIVSDVEGEVERVTADEIVIATSEGTKRKYRLQKFSRSNQDTCFNQRPIVRRHDRVKVGDVLTEGSATAMGELALGKNLLVAFMPWEGYNFEDAIVISQRLVTDEVFTSIHIQEFEVEAKKTKTGSELITADIPHISPSLLRHLDEKGIVRVGAWVSPNDIIVGKIAPVPETELAAEYKLLHSIFGEKIKEVKNVSLRVPYGHGGVVIQREYFATSKGDSLRPGVEELVKVYIAVERKITVGDKIAGRHGNKGAIAKILPQEDMPYLEDGTPVDIILNPLSVPSRMNLGQLLETLLGMVAKKKGIFVSTPIFNSITLEQIEKELQELGLPPDGKVTLYDGRTGEPFDQKVQVGYIYIMKLAHLAEDKIHARSIGPYSLITQQPLGGKAQFGGQRLGEMEVWALEGYGAANTLQELLTVKSDDINGRMRVYESIVLGQDMELRGVPESFLILRKELQALGLDVKVMDKKDRVINLDYLESGRRTKQAARSVLKSS